MSTINNIQVEREFHLEPSCKTAPSYYFHKKILVLLLVFGLFFHSNRLVAQWQQIFTFPNKEVPCLFFLNDFGKPNIGFAGVNREGVMKTTDGGKSWYKVNCPIDPILNSKVPATSITFKNEFEGWYISQASVHCYHTTDAGENWSILTTQALYNSIYYNKLKQRLFCTSFETSSGGDVLFSNDGGNNWQEYISSTTHGTLGIAFSDDLHGCFSVIGSPKGDFLYTTDGGDSWGTSSIQEECWQPLGLPNTKILFALNEGDINTNPVGELYRSDNGGINWRKIFQYRIQNDFPVTGTISRVLDSVLLFQTTTNSSEGFMSSTDGGYTWTPLCGPVGVIDTKFYSFDSYIYACDKYGNLWLNTTGIGSNSNPQLSKNNISLVSEFCNVKEDTLILTLFDSCNGRLAELLEASISGSSRFSVTGGGIPRTIIPNDTLRIIYTPDPHSALDESATLRLKFKLGWKVFDTIITITGRNITPQLDIALTPTVVNNNITAGNIAECAIYSSERVDKRGLNTIAFNLVYNNDLLEVESISSQSGTNASYGSAIIIDRTATLPITLTGNDITIEKHTSLINVKFKTFLTDTATSTIEVSSIQLNNDDPNYRNCTLSATGNSTTFEQASICGDSILREYMFGGELPRILNIKPNPAYEDILVTFNSLVSGQATLQVINDIGDVSFEGKIVVTQGQNIHQVILSSLSSGTYFVRLQIGKDVVTGKFVKQ